MRVRDRWRIVAQFWIMRSVPCLLIAFAAGAVALVIGILLAWAAA
jgi:hypothetical protein